MTWPDGYRQASLQCYSSADRGQRCYGYDDIDVWYDVALGKAPGFIYSRMSNPTVETLEAKIRELELAESAVAFSSGVAAISSVLYTFPAHGDRVVSTKDSYGGTNKIRA